VPGTHNSGKGYNHAENGKGNRSNRKDGVDPVTGRAIQKSVSAKTQAERKKLAKAIRENQGVPRNHTGDYTVAEWCRLRFGTYSKPNIRYNTAKGYEGIIEHHIIPAVGVIKLKQISSIHIQSIMT